MSGWIIALILIGVVTLDIVGLILFFSYLDRKRRNYDRHRREVGSRVRKLPEDHGEHHERRLEEIVETLDADPEAALNHARKTVSDVARERGFPEEVRRDDESLARALYALEPELAYDYREANYYMKAGRQEPEALPVAAVKYASVAARLAGVSVELPEVSFSSRKLPGFLQPPQPPPTT